MKWDESTLGEVVEADGGTIQTGPFGSQLHAHEYRQEGVPVIMPKDISEGRVIADSVARVSEQTANRLARHKLQVGAIVLPRRGEIAKRAFIGPDQEGWLCGTGCLKIELAAKSRILSEFLYYYMEQASVVRWLEQHAVGTTMLNLNTEIAGDLPIRFPHPDVQRAIVRILSSYNGLIENNRRRIALLEQAARLLYEEWFVRFRFPGHEHAKKVNGLPVGWETKTFDEEVCETIGGGTPATGTPEYWDGEVMWVVPTDVTRCGSLALLESARKITEKGLKESSAKMLAAEAILMTSRASVGFFALPDAPVCTNQGFINIIPALPFTRFYILQNLINRVEEIRLHAAGSTYPEISKSRFRSLPIVIPSEPIRTEFERICEQTHLLVKNLEITNRALQKTRDLLLPRLMSGEVEV